MRYPLSTGEAARLLGATEPQLSEVVRRGGIKPEPRVLAGRRMWERDHILQAAKALDLDQEQVRSQLQGEEVSQ